MSRQPVGEDAAEEDEQQLRHPGRREHEAEIGRPVRQVEHREGERDRRDRAPEQRDELAREEQAELALR